MTELIDFESYPVNLVKGVLLQDKATKHNIIWATSSYEHLGYEYYNNSQIQEYLISGINKWIVLPRVEKNTEQQQRRTRTKAEVFTPSWICNKMNNLFDEQWFGKADLFNTEVNGNWQTNTEKIKFTEGKSWKKYIDLRVLEITCGEAPYLCSRYDTSTGQIIPISNRIGILDRKMRVINENTTDEGQWYKWVIRAFQSCYGYEYQGDNLIIARINMLLSFYEYYMSRWKAEPTKKQLKKIANIISWNLWQMDGLKGTVPSGVPNKVNEQLRIYDLSETQKEQQINTECYLRNWIADRAIYYSELKGVKRKMKFSFAIGNPPYQEQISEETKNSSLSKQLFPLFIKESIAIGNNVLLITPSRWFAGNAQDKSFVKLRDFIKKNNHISVLYNYKNGKEVFPNTEIKGGVSFFLYKQNYSGKVRFVNIENEIEHQTIRNLFEDDMDIIISDKESYSILSKVKNHNNFITLTTITRGRNAFGIIGKESVVNSISTKNYFENAVSLRCKNNEIRWTSKENITKGMDLLYKYKVFISKSAGSPNKDLKIIGIPYIGEPLSVCTDSLIPIGNFNNKIETENLIKYLKSRFLRFMVSVVKVSQNVTQIVYKYVPLQDFTENSDIDWSKSIHEIDLQLYKKYGLDDTEIEFIEKNVKEMN